MDLKTKQLAGIAYAAVFLGFGVAISVYFAATATSAAAFWLWTLGAIMFLFIGAFLASSTLQILRRTGPPNDDERVQGFRFQSLVVLIVSTLMAAMLVLVLAVSIVAVASSDTFFVLGLALLLIAGLALIALRGVRKPPVEAAGNRR